MALADAIDACLARWDNSCYRSRPEAIDQRCRTDCAGQCFATGNAPGRQSRPASTVQWGSIFVAAPPSGAHGSSFRAANADQARALAKSACFKQYNSACRHLITYGESCGVAVAASEGKDVKGWYGRSLPNKAEAQRLAMADCQKDKPGLLCEVVLTTCTNGSN